MQSGASLHSFIQSFFLFNVFSYQLVRAKGAAQTLPWPDSVPSRPPTCAGPRCRGTLAWSRAGSSDGRRAAGGRPPPAGSGAGGSEAAWGAAAHAGTSGEGSQTAHTVLRTSSSETLVFSGRDYASPGSQRTHRTGRYRDIISILWYQTRERHWNIVMWHKLGLLLFLRPHHIKVMWLCTR